MEKENSEIIELLDSINYELQQAAIRTQKFKFMVDIGLVLIVLLLIGIFFIMLALITGNAHTIITYKL